MRPNHTRYITLTKYNDADAKSTVLLIIQSHKLIHTTEIPPNTLILNAKPQKLLNEI
jgi:hypothetical protein